MSFLSKSLGLPGRAIVAERLRALTAEPHSNPLFVFGNQKSGTTAIAGLLAAATGRRATLDLAGATAPHAGRLIRGETPLEDFIRKNAWSFSAPIVKEGNLTFVAEPLMDHFGVSRAIFILRNPYDNIRSMLNRLKLPGNLAALDVTTVRVNATWRAILSGEDLGLEPDHYVATLSHRWVKAVEVYRRARPRFTLVRYRDFRADKKRVIESLAQDFNLDAPNDIGPLLDHDFQRRGNPAADPCEFFGAENLARITDLCGKTATELGYSVP